MFQVCDSLFEVDRIWTAYGVGPWAISKQSNSLEPLASACDACHLRTTRSRVLELGEHSLDSDEP